MATCSEHKMLTGCFWCERLIESDETSIFPVLNCFIVIMKEARMYVYVSHFSDRVEIRRSHKASSEKFRESSKIL